MRTAIILHIAAICLFGFLPIVEAADTSLLFVGEDLSLVTIASRRAETVDDAPAIASVITADDIRRNGYMTLAEALSRQPGFFISSRHPGSVPYLRGLPASVLFLYDSVHLTSDAAKSVHPIDEELSLAAVERVEIIRGPGSVLWGPDAYSGLVNIVPKRGRDVNGLEIDAFGGTAREEGGAVLNWGHNAGLWEAFVSLSARQYRAYEDDYNIVRFAGPDGLPVPPSERMGRGNVDRSKYTEAVFNFSWQDWLRLSGRWSEANRKFILEDAPADLRWPASSLKPMWYVRMELQKAFGSSNVRLNAWYNEMDDKEREIDLEPRKLKNHVTYAEILYDRELWAAAAIFTMGASYRYNSINGAEIAKAYPPDFFDPGNILFLPRVQQTSFNTSLISGFAQIKGHWNRVDAWFGFRVDDHSEYHTRFSPNLGIRWSPSRQWNVKLLYGTAYRTPYASQLTGRDDLQPEEVQNASMSIAWHGSESFMFSAAAFWNQIRHQTQKDPYYGGLSSPGMQDIYGMELGAQWQITPAFNFQTNATVFAHDGDDETYQYYIYVFEDGRWVLKPWVNWSIPFETGPKGMVNAAFAWTPSDRLDVILNMKYEASWSYWYDKGERRDTVPANVVFDASMTLHHVFVPGLDLQVAVKNLFSRSYETRGTYGPIDSLPFNAYLGFRWKY